MKNQKNQERSCEISIFQTGQARPPGTSVQLLLVLTTFVACFFVALVFIEEEPGPKELAISKYSSLLNKKSLATRAGLSNR